MYRPEVCLQAFDDNQSMHSSYTANLPAAIFKANALPLAQKVVFVVVWQSKWEMMVQTIHFWGEWGTLSGNKALTTK